jgi:hypothetical protein
MRWLNPQGIAIGIVVLTTDSKEIRFINHWKEKYHVDQT